MSTVTLFFIGGVIKPAHTSVNCGLSARCYQSHYPTPITKISEHSLEVWQDIKNHFEERADPAAFDFWQQKIVVHFATDPLFCSVSFYPKDLASSQTWHIQKDKTDPPLEGFWAPYLSSKAKKRWGCLNDLPQLDWIVTSEDVDRSIEHLSPAIYPQMRVLLNDFLRDPLSQMIGFTYRSNLEGPHQIRFWRK